jgi:hypothetical protein
MTLGRDLMHDPSRLGAILARFPGPVRLAPSRRKLVLFLLGSMAFTAAGIVMIRSGDATGWFSGFFTLGIPIAIIMLLPGAAGLVLDGQGFEVTSLFRSHRASWADADGFAVAKLPPRGHQIVVYDNKALQHLALAQITVSRVGRNAALPDTYGLKPDALAELMTHWRAQALRSDAA